MVGCKHQAKLRGRAVPELRLHVTSTQGEGDEFFFFFFPFPHLDTRAESRSLMSVLNGSAPGMLGSEMVP